VYLDVTKAKDVKRLIDETKKTHGRIDYVFNNAGIAILGEVTEMSVDQWRKIVDVNLMGVIYGSIFAYEVMVGQGFGHIVNTASVAGLVPTPMITAYAATKHGVVGLSNSLRAEGRIFGVKVGVVCPGNVKTEIHDAAIFLNLDRERVIERVTLIISPEKAAGKIIRGVRRNKAITAFPLHSSIPWLLFRISPSLSFFITRGFINIFRGLKSEP
jgi:short-subunit dehydrogenase